MTQAQQLDWLDQLDEATSVLALGNVVRVNNGRYESLPYCIAERRGPCMCRDSEEHYHLTCHTLDGRGLMMLIGFREDGTSVWRDEHLEVA